MYSFSIDKQQQKKIEKKSKKYVSCAKKRLWKTVKCTAASDVIYLLLMVSLFSVFWFYENYWTLKQFSSLIDSQAHIQIILFLFFTFFLFMRMYTALAFFLFTSILIFSSFSLYHFRLYSAFMCKIFVSRPKKYKIA